MKKMFLSVAIVIAALVGITSCTSDASQCYQITVDYEKPVYTSDAEGKVSEVFEGRKTTTYVYMTSTNVNVFISEKKREYQVKNRINIKITKEKLDQNASDCYALGR